MKNLLVSLIVACVSTSALAETYLCIAEAAGGVKWIDGKWSGTSFNPNQKYLLRNNEWVWFGYQSGTQCKPDLFNKDILSCVSSLDHVRFNKKNLRFSAYYTGTYVFGQAQGGDTPAVNVGTCSRID